MQISEFFISLLGGTSAGLIVAGFLSKTLINHQLKKEIEVFTNEHKRDIEKLKHDLSILSKKEEVRIIKQSELEVTVSKFSGVILTAAKDLQDRLWHLTKRQSESKNPVLTAADENSPHYDSWPMTKRHYLRSTIYLFAQYFCWLEILRAEVRYLNFGKSQLTNEFSRLLKVVERSLSETSYQKLAVNRVTVDFPLFQMMQCEMGSSMIVENDQGSRCMTFFEFNCEYERINTTIESYTQLEKLIVSAVSKNKGDFSNTRLKILNNSLVDLIEFINNHFDLISEEAPEYIELSSLDLSKPILSEIRVLNKSMQPTAKAAGKIQKV